MSDSSMATFQAGSLLVSVPALYDPNFFRTVVLLFQSSDEGAAGIILNRPTNRKMSELGSEFANESIDDDQSVYSGGPVEGPLMAVHESLGLGEAGVIPGVFLSTTRENLIELYNQTKHRVRFVANYSGWGRGQLQNEIDAGGWIVVPATVELIFSDPEDLWKNICETYGSEVMLEKRFAKHRPNNPELN
ncbi:MAG: YqgE/AlgH family protein [Pirellulaceae bacterium]